MPDRSPHQGLPEDWDHGSHLAHGPFSTADESDRYGAGTAGSDRTRTTDGYGSAPTDVYSAAGPADAATSDVFGPRADSHGTGTTDAFGTRADSHGPGTTDAFGTRADSHGPGTADAFGTRADSHGPGTTDAFGIRPADMYRAGAADPFGDASPFGPRTADPFGPPATGAFGTKAAVFAPVPADAGTARANAVRPPAVIGDRAPGEAADLRGFLGALFDFGFTSFVTPKGIRVLYMLIMVGTVLSALVFTIIAFKASVLFGILTLAFGVPLFILIVLAIYRVLLEFFVVTFRLAEDVRAMRERGDPR